MTESKIDFVKQLLPDENCNTQQSQIQKTTINSLQFTDFECQFEVQWYVR